MFNKFIPDQISTDQQRNLKGGVATGPYKASRDNIQNDDNTGGDTEDSPMAA